jgi:lysyl-tRNA synthetase class 2
MTAEEQVRRDRLARLQSIGIDAYPAGSHRTAMIGDVLASFDDRLTSQSPMTLSGRVMAMRHIGALSFLRMMDESGTIQIVMRKDDLGEQYTLITDHLDVGDIIESSGVAYLTKTGEKSLLASNVVFLAKALKPLPEKWSGLQDIETRYRERELDLISNPESRHRLVVRSKLISSLRKFSKSRHRFFNRFPEAQTQDRSLRTIMRSTQSFIFVSHQSCTSSG